jgi:hypothetical protein
MLILLLSACNTNGPSSSSVSTNSPTSSSTSTNLPTYSQVLQTYPTGVRLCKTVVTVKESNGEILVKGDVELIDNKQRVRWYGTKVTAETDITFEGVTFHAGALLTVDKDLNWIEVSSWD